MEHTNLLYYETHSALTIDYPDEKVTSPRPGVAYARDDKKVIFNKKKVTYEVAVSYEDRSGNTLASGTTINTPEVLEGNTAKVVIYPVEVEDAKPVSQSQKITVSADTEYTFLYYILTSYTVTVNHMYEGSAITSATTIEVEAYEEEIVTVTIIPEDIPGYTAETVTISVSGDCEYDLEYETSCVSMEFVDLGLPSGLLWGTCNLGAGNPWESGNYYAWGEIEPKSAYTLENYKWYDGQDEAVRSLTFTKYGDVDGKRTLDDADDAAQEICCEGIHMPNYDDIAELVNNTSPELETIQGVDCMRLTSNENGNSIVIPNVGYYDGSGLQTDYGRFWTNYLFGDDSQAWGFGFCMGAEGTFNFDRNYGIPIRPVSGTSNEPEPFVPVEAVSPSETDSETRSSGVPERKKIIKLIPKKEDVENKEER